jgi:fatty acid desaturase
MAAVLEPEVESQLTEIPASYREALTRIGFPLDRLRELSRVRSWRAALDMVWAFGSLLAVPLLYVVWPHPLVLVAIFVLNIRTFNCCAQLVHTSDHGGLFRSPRRNDLAGNLAAYCLGYTRTGHRLAHLEHHRYLNTPRDPDRIWGAPEETTRELVRKWRQDFLLVSALARLLQYSQSDRTTFSAVPWKRFGVAVLARNLLSLWPVLVAQSLILAYYSVLLGPVHYLVLYVLPIFTVYPAQIRLRATVEHTFDVGYRPRRPEDYWVARSTRGAFLERFVFSPLGIQHHFEHHLFPSVPHYNIEKLRRLLVEAGFPVVEVPTYVGFVIAKMRAEKVALGSVK